MTLRIFRLTPKFVLLLMLLFGTATSAFSQQVFREGTVSYNVTIEGPADQFEGVKEYKGTYIITIKGNMQRKELKLDNGFSDVTIVDGYKNKVYSLRELGKKKYAIELDNKALKSKIDVWRGYTLNGDGTQQTIANIVGYKGVITYPNGNTCDIYYSKEWQPGTDMFEHFPDIQVLPLAYIINSTGGMNMHFKITSIDATPVEQSIFRVPRNYKIVSYEEYKQINN